MHKRLPYGLSNYEDIVEHGYAYVDKTRYIELIERESNPYQLLLRPRRFGKSLFLSMLESYYDLNKNDRFEELFKGLHIYENPTPERGKYAVLRFDFSGLDTASHDAFRKSFSTRVTECVIAFITKYPFIFNDAEHEINLYKKREPAVEIVHSVFLAASHRSIPIFVIVDEYDNFANNLIAAGKSYIDEVNAGGIVRTFYEILKIGTTSIVKRIFITGVTPMMLDDLSSGFNISDNVSLLPYYNDVFGFTSDEVQQLAAETGIDLRLIDLDMERYYNGYRFSEFGKNRVYNPQMVLFLFKAVLQLGMQPRQIIDGNLRTDYGRLRVIAENAANRDRLLRIMLDGEIESMVITSFSASDLQNEGYFVSFLFYLGMLTFGDCSDGLTRLRIPNYSVQTLYWEYMAQFLKNRATGDK